MSNSIRYTTNTLAEIIAQVVEFARDDYTPPDSIVPPEIVDTCGYIVACFLAQHTRRGEDGVDKETGAALLAVDRDMTYAERLRLALVAVATYGGAHNG